MTRQEKIEQYARGPARLKEALARVPKEALQWRPGPGKWSAHEVICHAADSETNAAMRIRFLLAEEAPAIMGYDQARWAERLDYHELPLEAALLAVQAVRANTVPLLRRMSEEDWRREGTHTEVGRYTAESWLDVYSQHLEKHAGQIERNLEDWKKR